MTLGRLHQCGIRAKAEYLGHLIDKDGIHATSSKLKAITEAPPPKNVRSFLGLLNYYCRFIPNLASIILNHLLHNF